MTRQTSTGGVVVNYWLFHVYPPEVGQAHRDGDIHIHDLDMLAGSSRFSNPPRNWSTTSTSRRAGATQTPFTNLTFDWTCPDDLKDQVPVIGGEETDFTYGELQAEMDLIFPGDTNHHGTLFGGTALAHMDKVAFITATRHAHVDFVTASCERIDFAAPAHVGEIAEITGRIVRAGTRSLTVEAELVADVLHTGERRLAAEEGFTMVAVDD